MAVNEQLFMRGAGVVWGKSPERAGGRTNLLLSHMLDTAAVAELIWDHFAAPAMKSALDAVAGTPGAGRDLFVWLCGVHDYGKATPAHQRLWAGGAEAVQAVGLVWSETAAAAGARGSRWRHDWAGGFLIRHQLTAARWSAEQVEWVWPLVAGHHGMFPTAGQIVEPTKARQQLRGSGAWPGFQRELLEFYTAELGFASVQAVQPVCRPSRALQLELSGLIVMADWIASDERHFVGIDDVEVLGLPLARERAAKAWAEWGFHGGWGRLEVPDEDTFAARFGVAARASQRMVLRAALAMSEPGIMVVEAPMGEGKTEAALMAAEVLAARFGADGIFVGLPTQATSDPMYTRVRGWVRSLGGDELADRVVLLHGKRSFNKEWAGLLGDARVSERFAGVDEYGCCDDPYGIASELAVDRHGPSEWFLAAKRGLLAPLVVGTVDQLLFAATRTRHVMLRSAGLAGKVVILDEIHACDVYMSQFLGEALWWLGQARIPVVLLSATLPEAQRRSLVTAYQAGAASCEEFAVELPAAEGYPCVTTAWRADGRAEVRTESVPTWRADLGVRVDLLPEEVVRGRAVAAARRRAQEVADASVADLLVRQLVDGGTALVIRNTVDRAQSLYRLLSQRFPDRQVMLLHGRFTTAQRADLTARALSLLGANAEGREGRRLVLVATQLAEQSFDVDADLLVTDLAPIDLMLQRIGRLHRHADTWRPQRLARPQVWVTGVGAITAQESPSLPRGAEAIYGAHLLLRTAALLAGPGPVEWRVPCEVPGFVARVYGDDPLLVPDAWAEAARDAAIEHERLRRERAENAQEFLLTRKGEHEQLTLAGLHFAGAAVHDRQDALDAAVRDGEPSVEVQLIVRDSFETPYRTLSGRALTVNGDVAPEMLEEVLGDSVRLPSSLTDAALELAPLPGWREHPWLRRARALVLGADRSAVVGRYVVRYDDDLGLVVSRQDQAAF